MKKTYLFAGFAALMLASCSTEEQSGGGYVAGSKITVNATLPNSVTRVNEAPSDTYGLITTWSDDDHLNVLINDNAVVTMAKSTGNTFTITPPDATVASTFNAGKTIYGVNNNHSILVTTALNGNRLNATLYFTGQDGTVDNLKKYDMMYGKGDPTGNITFNHKICVMRLDINSSQLRADNITSIKRVTLTYVPTSGSQLFASQEVYNFGATCDSTITDAQSCILSNTNISVTSGAAKVYIAVPNRKNLYGTLKISIDAVDGTGTSKNYTLANAISLTNGRMLMSTVHPLAIRELKETVNIGDYLFSDGMWGTLADNPGKTPVAVIFSTTTSTADQAHGWKHGYAMALKNVSSTKWKWGPLGTNPTGSWITTDDAAIADKDGLTYTPHINSSTYPAGYAAATTAPSSTSGWYLPSIGQWFDIFVNLGRMNATVYSTTGYDIYWFGQAATCVKNLNSYLTCLTSGTFTTFGTSDYYWSSSEYRITDNAYSAYFASGNVRLDYCNKTNNYLVRGVLAF